jgi:hypothetical protein
MRCVNSFAIVVCCLELKTANVALSITAFKSRLSELPNLAATPFLHCYISLNIDL